MHEKTKNTLLIAFIAIVAIVGLVILFLYAPGMGTGKGYTAVRFIGLQ